MSLWSFVGPKPDGWYGPQSDVGALSPSIFVSLYWDKLSCSSLFPNFHSWCLPTAWINMMIKIKIKTIYIEQRQTFGMQMVLNITCGLDHIFLNQPLLIIHWTRTSTHHYATLFFFFRSLGMNLIVSQNFAMSVKGYAMYQVHINHYQFWRPTINAKSSTSEEIALSCCMLIGPFLRLYSLTMNISTSFIRFFTRVSQYERLIQSSKHIQIFLSSPIQSLQLDHLVL